jgi:hypothetical protein
VNIVFGFHHIQIKFVNESISIHLILLQSKKQISIYIIKH